jgi:hypothetical protein
VLPDCQKWFEPLWLHAINKLGAGTKAQHRFFSNFYFGKVALYRPLQAPAGGKVLYHPLEELQRAVK